MKAPRLRGAALGLAAAALFGASTPLSKLLLPRISFVLLSALLYLGAGAGVALLRTLRLGVRTATQEARLRRTDLPALAGVVLFGGLAGPILLLLGLSSVSGIAASLLLNLEAPFTILLAVLVFREHLGRPALIATGGVLLGAALLAYGQGHGQATWSGVAAIAGACLAWAVDNNLSQVLSLRDPLAVVQVKALGAGSCALAIALASGAALPPAAPVFAALALGSVSYGVSLVLSQHALRAVGAARQAAFFATAPFLGALLSAPLLHEPLTPLHALAAGLMAAGVAGLLRERHRHVHVHEELEHDHLHVHDEHHRHEHAGPVVEPHSHLHRHERLTHEHAHAPDLHHRHPHR